ncbi:hypothetical protein ACGFK1_10230 [Mycobacterium sp. NPDC048908]|uniref:hypothetical protein n=1 Tax=Mycobacterium sp. NPDC048908 TaxID=3364292 RepID=UPI003721CD0A
MTAVAVSAASGLRPGGDTARAGVRLEAPAVSAARVAAAVVRPCCANQGARGVAAESLARFCLIAGRLASDHAGVGLRDPSTVAVRGPHGGGSAPPPSRGCRCGVLPYLRLTCWLPQQIPASSR